MSWTVWVTLPLLLMGARHREPRRADLNAQGYEQYQQGNFPKAVVLLRKAVGQSPKNAYAWLNLGRAIAASGQGTTPEDECDDERNWKYAALRAFNRALALDRDDVLAKLKQPDTRFALFRDTAEYRKWLKGQGPIPRSEADATQFFTEESSWFLPVGDVTFLDLEPGGTVQRYGPTDDNKGEAEGHWRIRKAALEITLTGGKVLHYQLLRGPYSWNLKGPDGTWEPAPFLRDCTEKK